MFLSKVNNSYHTTFFTCHILPYVNHTHHIADALIYHISTIKY